MSEKPVVVDFGGMVRPMQDGRPILEEIASENDSIVIVKLNVDENPLTAADYGITSIPTMNVYSGGQVVKTTSVRRRLHCSRTSPSTCRTVLRLVRPGRPSRGARGSRTSDCDDIAPGSISPTPCSMRHLIARCGRSSKNVANRRRHRRAQHFSPTRRGALQLGDHALPRSGSHDGRR